MAREVTGKKSGVFKLAGCWLILLAGLVIGAYGGGETPAQEATVPACALTTAGCHGDGSLRVPTAGRWSVPFDLPAKEQHFKCIYPCREGRDAGRAIGNDGSKGGEYWILDSCDDTRRVLLTDQDGKKHCYALYLLGEK